MWLWGFRAELLGQVARASMSQFSRTSPTTIHGSLDCLCAIGLTSIAAVANDDLSQLTFVFTADADDASSRSWIRLQIGPAPFFFGGARNACRPAMPGTGSTAFVPDIRTPPSPARPLNRIGRHRHLPPVGEREQVRALLSPGQADLQPVRQPPPQEVCCLPELYCRPSCCSSSLPTGGQTRILDCWPF